MFPVMDNGCPVQSDSLAFSAHLERCALSFWELLQRSHEFGLRLSSIDIICTITKFLLENEELCQLCINKFNISNLLLPGTRTANYDGCETGQIVRSEFVEEPLTFVRDASISLHVPTANVSSEVNYIDTADRSSQNEGASAVQAYLEHSDTLTESQRLLDCSLPVSRGECEDKTLHDVSGLFVDPSLQDAHLTISFIDRIQPEHEIYTCRFCNLVFESQQLATDHHLNVHRAHRNVLDENGHFVGQNNSIMAMTLHDDTARSSTDFVLPDNPYIVPPLVARCSSPHLSCVCRECGIEFSTEQLLTEHSHASHAQAANSPQDPVLAQNSSTVSNYHEDTTTDQDSQCVKYDAKEAYSELTQPSDLDPEALRKSLLEVGGLMKTSPLFACSYCQKVFSDKCLVELHLSSTHEPEKLSTFLSNSGHYKCPVCQKVSGTKRHFTSHVHIHLKKRFYICIICHKQFLWHSCVFRHVKAHGVQDINSFFEVVTTASVPSESKGLQTRTRKAKQRRSSDSRDAANKENGKARESVPVADQHKCLYCREAFLSEGSCRMHTEKCSRRKWHQCQTCAKFFQSQYNLRRHFRRVHSKVNKEASAETDEQFTCSTCLKSFKEKRYLRQHSWTHKRQGMHRCRYCARYFIRKEFLQDHVRKRHSVALGGRINEKSTQHQSESQLCAVCGDPNADITEQGGYMCLSCAGSKSTDKTITCPVCGIHVKGKRDLLSHSRVHEAREHKCDVCGKTYKQKHLLEIHYKEHSGDKPFCCETCGLRFGSGERLKSHILNVHSQRLRRHAITYFASSLCPVCDIRIRSKDQMWNHLLIHSGKFDLYCNYCDRFFDNTEELSAHGEIMHAHTETPFCCKICEVKFSEKAKFLDHLGMHPEKEIHNCQHCSRTFYLHGDLREHTKSTHERKKRTRTKVQEQALAGVYKGPFPCQICGRVYQKKASLEIHLKIHYGIFDYPCDFCEKKFKSAAEFRIHRRGHTQEKPYSCSYCGEKFTRHSTMTQHKRRHTNERPYLCDDCGMSFKSTKVLKNHKLGHDKHDGASCHPLNKDPEATSRVTFSSGAAIAAAGPKPVPGADPGGFQLSQALDLAQEVFVMPLVTAFLKLE